jgi:hypothetical protein
MSKQCFVPKSFSPKSLALIDQCNSIIEGYQRQGYDLTLRQLYYQLVSRNAIPNKQTAYDNLGSLVSDARRAGLIDWRAIVDRTRNLRALPHWANPADIISSAAAGYRRDLWADQPNYVEVWVEKDALVGVIQRAANAVDVPYFSCRGYTSDSEIKAAADRLRAESAHRTGHCIIIHLGDHDPSGIDMTRDIEDRIWLLGGPGKLRVDRIALNLDQVERYNPPPNPAKLTDSRCDGYIERFGYESWELDALPPDALHTLIRERVEHYLNLDLYNAQLRQQAEERSLLRAASDYWPRVVDFLRDKGLYSGPAEEATPDEEEDEEDEDAGYHEDEEED